jgi:hypothetical protein
VSSRTRARFAAGCSLGSPLNARPLDARWLMVAAVISVLGWTAETSGQNLVMNGDFANSLDSWQLEGAQGGSAFWSPTDVSNLASSGSALIVHDQPCVEPNPGQFICRFPALVQCIAITGGANYSVGFSSLIPSGQEASGATFLYVDLYSGDACDTESLSHPVLARGGVGSWATEVQGLSAPQSARSLRLILAASRRPGLQGSFRAHFDDVFVNGPDRLPEVPGMSRYGLFVLALALGVGGSVLIVNRSSQ